MRTRVEEDEAVLLQIIIRCVAAAEEMRGCVSGEAAGGGWGLQVSVCAAAAPCAAAAGI